MKKFLKGLLNILSDDLEKFAEQEQEPYVKGTSFDKLAARSNNESSRGEKSRRNALLPKATLTHGQTEFEIRNPSFDEEKFVEKVKIAFDSLFEALKEKDINSIKRFISDAVYQRYKCQIEMMEKLNLNYNFHNQQILDTAINEYECEKDYDIIHIGIKAKVDVNLYSVKYPVLNYVDTEYFIEYWSFLRKRGSLDGDIYTNNNCPNCGSPLPTVNNDVLQCEYCHSIITASEYDWVLAEITQEEDYLYNRSAKRDFRIFDKIDNLNNINSDFSVQMLEDKISNGYIQILNAIAEDKLYKIRRFVSEEIYGKLNERDKEYFYYKLFINHVTLIDLFEKDGYNYIDIKVKSSFQRVRMNQGEEIEYLDDYLCKRMEVIRVMRNQKDFVPKGELYAHSCPNCGGNLDETDDIKCPYCKEPLANPNHEWIIIDIIPWLEYNLNKNNRF